jgi:hypothetical protein
VDWARLAAVRFMLAALTVQHLCTEPEFLGNLAVGHARLRRQLYGLLFALFGKSSSLLRDTPPRSSWTLFDVSVTSG